MIFYAINKETKEHRIADEMEQRNSQWRYVRADADGWIPWEGGECPLPDKSRCGVEHRDGEVFGNTFAGSTLASDWSHTSDVGDIIAYRPILDNKPNGNGVSRTPIMDSYRESQHPEVPEWDGEGLPPVGVGCECREAAYGAKGNFTPCRTVHKTSKGVILVEFEGGDFGYGVAPDDFRPLRSAEDKAVEEMLALDCEPNEGMLSRADFCRALYRAGFRRQAEEATLAGRKG